MKTVIYSVFIVLILLFISCNGNKQSTSSADNPPVKLTKAEVKQAVKDYFMHKFKNPVAGETESLVRIQGDMEIALFNENKIFIGKLDNDETEDAMITYGYQKTGTMAYDRHLILLNKGALKIVKDFPAAMQIEEISGKRVIALIDTTTKTVDTKPCPTCQVLVQFMLEGDSLVRVKK